MNKGTATGGYTYRKDNTHISWTIQGMMNKVTYYQKL